MITSPEYAARRAQLARRLPTGAIAIIPAAHEVLRNGDAHYRFRQDSDFYYLTGFNEPDALLLITAGEPCVSILFNRPKNPAEEQWTGARLGQDGACVVLGVSEAHPLADLDTLLPGYLAGMHRVYYAMGRFPDWEARVLDAWRVVKGQARQGKQAPESFCDLSPILGDLRLFKSDAEIACMKQAARITVTAHERAMQACSHASYEYQLEAEITYEFTRQGCRSSAYDSIVAGGKNACVLHYTDNNQRLVPGELVLIDAGAECEHYAADVTRTYPINGQFNAEQRLIYELVLRAQQDGIACVRPGCAWDEMQRTIVRVLTEGLVELGLLTGRVDDLIANAAYKPFYMHTSGHWLGMDVHDCGRYKIDGQWRALESGMVLTVEPGLYIPAELDGVDPRWWNIGVRIEDDILVTPDGHENLTGALAVTIDDLEALVRG